MKLTSQDLMLITGATGFVGSHVAEQARERGIRVRSLARPGADTELLRSLSVEILPGDLAEPHSLFPVCQGVTVVVHCAAKVGDWGDLAEFRRINVAGTGALIDAALAAGTVKRWVQVSSLGVYQARDHYGTDESTPACTSGIDGYTVSKAESESLVQEAVRTRQLPAVTLRPGFIYGPRDRTILPRLIDRLATGKFAYLGNPQKLMNNTFVGNLCQAIWLAIERDDVIGEVFNIRDPRAVTKQEFINTICDAAGIRRPDRAVPFPVARAMAAVLEGLWRLLRKQDAPLVNRARIKFLGLNLDFSIEKAMHDLGYDPASDFTEAMPETVRGLGKT